MNNYIIVFLFRRFLFSAQLLYTFINILLYFILKYVSTILREEAAGEREKRMFNFKRVSGVSRLTFIKSRDMVALCYVVIHRSNKTSRQELCKGMY